jgi:hypothetical protein
MNRIKEKKIRLYAVRSQELSSPVEHRIDTTERQPFMDTKYTQRFH